MDLRDLTGGNLNMADMIGKLAEMRQTMEQVQKELDRLTVDVEVGGGMVRVTATGSQRITAIKMEPAIVDPEDREMLEDLIIAGVNKALEEAGQLARTEVRNKAGSMLIPGMDPGMLGL